MNGVKVVSTLRHGGVKSIPRISQLRSIGSTILNQKQASSGGSQSNYSTSARPFLRSNPRSKIVPRQMQRTVSAAATTNLKKTALYDLHETYGAKMVPFAGYWMPVQYADLAVGESHKWTREKASLFDVGHMSVAVFCLITILCISSASLILIQGSTSFQRFRSSQFPEKTHTSFS